MKKIQRKSIQACCFLILVTCFLSITGCEILKRIFSERDDSSITIVSVDGMIDPQEASSEFGIPVISGYRAALRNNFIDSLIIVGNKLEKLEVQLSPTYKLKAWNIKISKYPNYSQLNSGGGLNDEYFMSLIKSESGLSGLIRSTEGVFKIVTIDNKNVTILKIDTGLLPNEKEPDWKGDDVDRVSQPQIAADASLFHIHDLLIVYTDDVETNRVDFQATIITAITEANLAYSNSNVNNQLNLVASLKINYDETKDIGTDLDRLTNTNDGFLDEIHRWRDRYGADLVLFLVLDAGDSCGKANLQVSSSNADDDRAFAVAAIDCLYKQTLVHELAHLAGAHHNTGNDPFPFPGYAHGWVRPDQFSPNRGWRSIMAYCTGDCGKKANCDDVNGCPRFPVAFSNPNIQIGGKPAGNDNANNARRLNETGQALADFRLRGARVSLYEGNHATQDHVCVIPVTQNRSINFSSYPNERGCDSDEARSITLYEVPAGKVFRIYDNPEGNRQDDWTEIIVKRNVAELDIPTFENSFENNDVRVIYHGKDGLDGKVSCFEIDSEPSGPTIDFFEGNNATQNLLCSVPVGQQRTINFQNHAECDNDEARSSVIYNANTGQVFNLFDSADGNRQDDWVEIIIKRDVPELKISTFENSIENDNVRVVYHRKNGLDGKVSRLEVGSTPTGSTIDFYEGNNAAQDLICSLPVGQAQTYKFSDVAECANDEARSMILFNIPAGTVLIFYDSPEGNLEDDWLAIKVKQNITSLQIDNFEQSFSNAQIDAVYSRNNGLDGKVSRLRVTNGNSMDGIATFYEGNNGTQNKVCSLNIYDQEVRFRGHGSCDNDEARSVVLSLVPNGTQIQIYDDPDCESGDDFTIIQVKQDIFRLVINSFESSFENSQVRVTVNRDNGLDGKVSCVRIDRP